MTIVEGISYFKEKKNISVYELCRRSDLSQSTIYNLTRRANDPSIDTLRKVCTGLGIRIADFFYFLDMDNDITHLREFIADYLTLSPKQQYFMRFVLTTFKDTSP